MRKNEYTTHIIVIHMTMTLNAVFMFMFNGIISFIHSFIFFFSLTHTQKHNHMFSFPNNCYTYSMKTQRTLTRYENKKMNEKL